MRSQRWLAGKSEAGIITPVQMAKPPYGFTPSQISFHILVGDRSFITFETLDYCDFNFLLVQMCGSMASPNDRSPITPNTMVVIGLKLAPPPPRRVFCLFWGRCRHSASGPTEMERRLHIHILLSKGAHICVWAPSAFKKIIQ
jgi:hypothetical protein